MKKSNFIATLLGWVAGMWFALGMCMALIPSWNLLYPGAALGGAGILLGIVALLIWRKMEGKPPIRPTGRGIVTGLVATVGALALGVGMCFSMVFDKMVLGIAIGLVGMGILLCLYLGLRGIREE